MTWFIKCTSVATYKGHTAFIVTAFGNDHNVLQMWFLEVPRDGLCFYGRWKLAIFSKRLARKFWYAANMLYFLSNLNIQGVRSILSSIRPRNDWSTPWVLIKRNVSSYILQGLPSMAIKLQGFNTILTFGGSHLFKVLRGHLATFLG